MSEWDGDQADDMVVEFDEYDDEHSIEFIEEVVVNDDGTVVDSVTVVESTSVELDDDSVEDVMVLEEVDNELVLMVWEPTGEPRVDDALELLSKLDMDDVHQHASVYTEIHEQLRATLTNADAATD